MSQIFDRIKVGNQKRNTFDLSHNQVMTSDFGYLTPICIRDMVPNDDFVVTPQIFCRLAPPALPFYGRIKARVHHFFVPYRILYPQWNSFITQDPNNNTVPPYFLVSTLKSALNSDPQFNSEASLLDRGVFGRLMANLGINPDLIFQGQLNNSDRISAFPFLAYYRIWLDWFMDSSIYDHAAYERTFNDNIKDGGSMALFTKFLETRYCCYKKDYFTTARVSPQGGHVAPTPDIVDPALVGVDIASSDLNPAMVSSSSQSPIQLSQYGNVGVTGQSGWTNKIGQFTVEALRAANSLQRYLERNNFVGTKIINRILAHFGIAPTPERLDMAEFIDGDDFDFQVGDVTSTGFHSGQPGSFDLSGLGQQAGKGIGVGNGRNGATKSVSYHAKEHGIFMSIMSILPDTSYYQGIPRMFQKGVFGDALDFFTPEFENLGYQEILNKEVYVHQGEGDYQEYDPDGVFGYSPRFSEYKFSPGDILSGDFVGTYLLSPSGARYMDAWHLFRKLYYDGSDPLALNENFVELRNHNTDYDRVFQLTSDQYDHFYFNIFCDVKATRPMDGFTAPSLDHTNEADGNSINLPYGGTRL